MMKRRVLNLLASYALLLPLCGLLLVSCTPPPGSVPIHDFFLAQQAAREGEADEKEPGMVPGRATLSNITSGVFDERAYIQQRFAGKKVVFPSELAAEGGTARPTAYTIGPEDILRIFVWQNPDLSGETVVQPDGTISLPLLGEVQASGLTVRALQQKLTEAYRAFVLNPQVAAIPLQLNSRRIFTPGANCRDHRADAPDRRAGQSRGALLARQWYAAGKYCRY